MRKHYMILALLLIIAAFVAGTRFAFVAPEVGGGPVYSSGYYDKAFFERAYEKSVAEPFDGVTSALVAHHLLVADKIAEVFESAASDEVRTVVLVSPNHFSLGTSSAQVSAGSWSTPYGVLASDTRAIDRLLRDMPELRHEEYAAPHEHGVGALTPYIVRSFPNAKFVPIILDETLSAESAWKLGGTIATQLPDAVLFASIDMTHNQTAEYTAANDARVLTLIENFGMCGGTPCTAQLDIDSNASMRVLFGFNEGRAAYVWRQTHHGSSLAMGATRDWRENTSHILGYFTKAD